VTGVRLCKASFDTETNREETTRVESENGRNGEESREWYSKWNVTITNNIQTEELPRIYKRGTIGE
jgi:hypothetical protein